MTTSEDEEAVLKALEHEQMNQYYQQNNPPQTDRTREIDAVNRVKPYKYEYDLNEKGEIINQRLQEGDAPMEVIVEYYGLLNQRVSLTNIQTWEDEVELESLMNIIQMDIRTKHKRDWFNQKKNADEDMVSLFFKLGVMMSRDNIERQNTISSKNEDNKRMTIKREINKPQLKKGGLI